MLLSAFTYLGWNKGFTSLSESMADSTIVEYAKRAFEEAQEGIKHEYSLGDDDLDSWNNHLLEKIRSLQSADLISDIPLSPEHVIKRDGVLTGAALLCRKNGSYPYFLVKSIAAVLIVLSRSTIGPGILKDDLERSNMKDIIRSYCGLLRESGLVESIYQEFLLGRDGSLFEEDLNRADVLKRAYRLGFEKEKVFKGCAQCHLLAQFDLTGQSHPVLFMAAGALAAGIGRCGDGSCGAYTGGVLFMGTAIGRRLEYVDNDRDNWNVSYEMTQKLQEKFINAYGTVTCAHIHEDIFGRAYILKDTSVRDDFEKAGAHADKCTTVVAYAVMWVAEILIEKGYLIPGKDGETNWNPPKL
jgi:hypothetical protein